MNTLQSLVTGVLLVSVGGCARHTLLPPGHDGGADGARDGGDAGLVCAPLVLPSGECDGASAECQRTWAAVLANPACDGSADAGEQTRELRLDCGDAYHVRRIEHPGQTASYIYAAATGELVEIKYDRPEAAGGSACYGPPEGVPADCANATAVPLCAADGGVLACPPLDLAGLCAGGTGAECQPSWADVLANPRCISPSDIDERRKDCGAYHVRTVFTHFWASADLYAHSTDVYYYDATTGALVAIYGPRRGALACFAGSVDAIPSECVPPLEPGDASVDPAVYGAEVCVTDGGTHD